MYVTVMLLILYQTGWVELQCIMLHPTDMTCLACSNKYYLSSGRCYSCPTSCTICTSRTSCSKCKPYYYGSKCQYDCLGCSDKTCIKTNGTCPSDCNAGYFKQTQNKCAKCRTTCKECDDYDHCTECIEGTFLQQVSGHVYCTNCSSRCSSCSDFNTCTQCKQLHYWGTYCQNDCMYCLSDCEKNNGCSAGCIGGYYKTLHITKGGYECNKCPSSCVSCTDTSHCQECRDNFYGEANSTCTECSANCRIPLHCNKFSGYCTNGCRDGWSGDKCTKSCPSGCIKCEQYNSSACGICSVGLYGDMCERQCSLNCKTEDGEQICNKRNGYCDNGCKDAFWGHSCENDCGAGCNESICNETSGVCINRCKLEYYGTTCKFQCSKHCVSRESVSTERICHEETGECLLGCMTSWFGITCDNECSKQCNGAVCDRNNGTCTFGYIEGYVGSSCSQAIVLADDVSTTVAAIGGGAGAGIFVLVTVVVVLSGLLWRRRQQRTETSNNLPGESQGNNQQEEDRYQNLMLNAQDRPAGFGNDRQAKSSISDANIDDYQELNERISTENAYSTLSANANTTSTM